jgi:hypothetical protein
MLIVKLTAEQVEQLAGAHAKIVAMADAGKPGILAAQIYGDHMRVGIMSNEAAHAMYDALCTPAERRREHSTAYELLPEAGTGPACNLLRPWEEP